MKHKPFILIIFLIVVLSFVATIYMYNKKDGNIAEIYSDDKLIHIIDLSNVTDSYEFPVEWDGHKNVVFVEKGRISVKSADCPDKLCVKQGAISSSAFPVVCAPNNLYIKIVKSSKEDVDAVSR